MTGILNSATPVISTGCGVSGAAMPATPPPDGAYYRGGRYYTSPDGSQFYSQP
jgi:hypothetical protein